MSQTSESKVELAERDVAAYLRDHPDFFERHHALLELLQLPHPQSGESVSLLERQNGLIREQKSALKRQLHQLSQAARSNEALLERLQILILDLISSRDLEQMIDQLHEALLEDFHADAVSLHLVGVAPGRSEAVTADDPKLDLFKSNLEGRKTLCGYLSDAQLEFLFGHRAEEIASAVVIPICGPGDQACLGLLAIGSIDPKRYHPEMGTVFVNHLGAVMSRVLRGFLD